MVKPAYKVLSVTPPVYKTVTEKVLVKEPSKKYIYIRLYIKPLRFLI